MYEIPLPLIKQVNSNDVFHHTVPLTTAIWHGHVTRILAHTYLYTKSPTSSEYQQLSRWHISPEARCRSSSPSACRYTNILPLSTSNTDTKKIPFHLSGKFRIKVLVSKLSLIFSVFQLKSFYAKTDYRHSVCQRFIIIWAFVLTEGACPERISLPVQFIPDLVV
jgi:hypothetical protein